MDCAWSSLVVGSEGLGFELACCWMMLDAYQCIMLALRRTTRFRILCLKLYVVDIAATCDPTVLSHASCYSQSDCLWSSFCRFQNRTRIGTLIEKKICFQSTPGCSLILPGRFQTFRAGLGISLTTFSIDFETFFIDFWFIFGRFSDRIFRKFPEELIHNPE